ncbi:PiggyBac_transposable element-derived protein [Hexamita inflata]|uniref:PiggyBac transposable element-derived protein n=1 Tax=Hexamita inflata TaxID=28002 RepID=A0AA86NR67_9EUKA|nr:PiggyBac transposable element-derived protein [Hexamita inflata]
MIYTKSKFVKQPCQLQEFVSSRGIPREQPEIVRYYNNNYKGVDYRPTYKNIKFPGRCTRWTTRMFIYFMQVILVNGFSLMKLLHPEYKEIKITDYIESIIDQMKINLTKYEIKATPRKIEGCNQPVSPIKDQQRSIQTLSCIQKQVRNVSAAIMQQQICVFVQRISFVSRVLQNAYQ